MPKKGKKLSYGKSAECCCDMHDIKSYERGKSLFKITIGLLLVSFGFGYISLQMLALTAGALYCLVGIVRMMSKDC